MHEMHFADYRRFLLQAVELLLDGTEAAQNQVREIMTNLPTPTDFSINSLVWQYTISSLGDSVIRRENPAFWLRERLILSGVSPELQRVYICYTFRRFMSNDDQVCFDALLALCQFLEGFPFTTPTEALEDHSQKEQAALATLNALPQAADIGDELVYRWILREVGAALAPIALKPSLNRFHYLIPQPPYSSLQVGEMARNFPNAGSLLGWAKRALGALDNSDWLLLTWHLAGETLVLSLL